MIPQDIAHEPSWYESSARARIDGVLDPGSFTELLGPQCRIMSPHLALFDLPPAFDDGMIVGRGLLDGHPVAVAAQEGQFMGGTFAEVSGAKLVGLLRAAAASAGTSQTVSAVLLLLDTGGVRLQEANAGELAVSETIRAVLAVRQAGIPVIALIGGRAGAFGGGSLVASCCSRIVMTEQGRISVTGPEVIETNKGAEEFDSRDRALVWRVTGGRSRALLGGADRYIRGDVASFRAAARDRANPPAFDIDTMRAEQVRLEKRLERYGDCHDTPEIWARMNLPDPAGISEIDDAAFIERLAATGGAHDAR
ncbi:biotin-independent malonate decarboxylase subunit beta [Gluconacetobacter takamatsuzukensis]|uniref:Biotin-independent malonate decarboxylase subunit beta n=1 Tax=Gluconacetobacter takamatsuzukensis TaxID=1286190 RepID=A0A7W4PTD5_9PROT|nr:biotin-independent malonate decarboxylase subunit beta [Gluconacetobacter takamatsuzukensis]MBB2205871.1 biotin-independent malonate decarboxylase subunit beta [Gluconacetobacter takamatsuzukensis]